MREWCERLLSYGLRSICRMTPLYLHQSTPQTQPTEVADISIQILSAAQSWDRCSLFSSVLYRDMDAYSFKSRADVVVDEVDDAPRWKLPEPPPLRSSGPLIQIEDVSFSYPPLKSSFGDSGAPSNTTECA